MHWQEIACGVVLLTCSGFADDGGRELSQVGFPSGEWPNHPGHCVGYEGAASCPCGGMCGGDAAGRCSGRAG